MNKAISTILSLLLVTYLWGAFMLEATAQTTGGVIAISDPVLENKVREMLNKPEGNITPEDAATLSWLDANAEQDAPDSARIKDISALRYFVNLTGLKLDNNSVQDVTALSGLANLKELWLLGNPMDNLESLGMLTGLVKLGFDSRFRDLSFLSNLTNLEELRIDACRDLPKELGQLKKLKVFCSLGGELTDISLLAQIPTLTVVDVSWNLVSDLTPLSNLPLTELYLAGNPIENYAPIKGLMAQLIGKNFDYYETKQPENPNAVITFVDPVMEKKVRAAMGKADGDITAGDAAKITKLEIGNEWAKEIPKDMQVSNLQGIEYFISLRELNAGFNAITDISALSTLSELKNLNMGGNAINDISALSKLTNLENLTLFGNSIRDISPLSSLTKLQSLQLDNNPIFEINTLAGLTNINNLYIGECGIEDISPLAGMTNMYSLELSNNYISDLSALSGMTNLAILKLANNPIQDYSPIQDIYPKLQEKDFEYGQVFDIPLPLKPDQPEEPIVISDAGLEAILREITGVKDRAITRQDACRITKIAGSNDTLWQTVSDITALKYCLNLEELIIKGSMVSDLSPLCGLTQLNVLVIDDSSVSDLTPLRGMEGIGYLELRGNKITDVTPLQTLPQLVGLDISYNQIADLSPLYMLNNLQVLRINHNLIKDASGFADIAQGLKDKDFDPAQPLDSANQQGGSDAKDSQQKDQTIQIKNPEKGIKFADKVLEKKVREAIGKPEGIITAGDAASVDNLNLGNEWQEKFPKGSQISNLGGIEYFINLKSLDISWNKIKDISKIADMTKLENLRAFGNQISNITPLAGLTNLNSLNIGGNKVTKIDALKGLLNLTSLFLNDNTIKDYSPIEMVYPKLVEKDFTLD